MTDSNNLPPELPNTDPTADQGTSVPPPDAVQNDIQNRADRLAGEPAPEITPEDFARLQKLGTLNLDPRGRIRPDLGRADDPGVSLRRRRAWYK